MERKRYGKWAGNKAGVIEDMSLCTEEVYPTTGFGIPHQCNRKRGYGVNKAYCKQHARMQERKLTKHAPDVVESAPLQALPTPEVNPVGEVGSTPATTQVM